MGASRVRLLVAALVATVVVLCLVLAVAWLSPGEDGPGASRVADGVAAAPERERVGPGVETRGAASSGGSGGALGDSLVPPTWRAEFAEARAWALRMRGGTGPLDDLLATYDAVAAVTLLRKVSGEDIAPHDVFLLSALAEVRAASFDLDFDGRFSEAELRLDTRLSYYSNPAVMAALDTDGDGMMSEVERRAGRRAQFELEQRVLEDLGARVLLPRFDLDRDGALSAAERASAGAGYDADGDGVVSDEEWARAGLAAGERAYERVDEAMKAELPASRPIADPSAEAFDLDGDGRMDAEETRAWHDAVIAARRAVDSERYRAVARDRDLNGDGSVDAAEWLRFTASLSARVTREISVSLVDADRDGVVSQADVEAFRGWYQAGAARADVNLDGVIDASDLRLVVELARAAGD